MRTITALHTLQDGKAVTSMGNLPGPDEWVTASEMLAMARQIHQHAIDAQRASEASMLDLYRSRMGFPWTGESNWAKRHEYTPNFLEFAEPPAYDDACNFEPVGIDSEGGSHD